MTEDASVLVSVNAQQTGVEHSVEKVWYYDDVFTTVTISV